MTLKRPTRSSATDTGHACDYAAIALAYAKGAVADKRQRQHCKFVRQAAQRHLDDLKRAKKGWDFYFDPWHANDVCDFIEKLPHVEGRWETPTIRLEPAQIFFLAVIFGWREQETGLRRFTDVYIEMARKGAKSTLTAAVVLYCTACEDEPGPLSIIAAATGDQAGKVFNPLRQMVLRTPALQEAFGFKAWARTVECLDNGGVIRTINSKSSTQDGHNPHVAVLDELHAHKDRGLFDVVHSADGARRNPLYWKITTAGFHLEGVCYQHRLFVTKVLAGIVKAEHVFAIIFTIDGPKDFTPERKKGDDPYDEKVWIKPNPLMPVGAPSLASMRRLAAKAKNSPQDEGEFFTKRLNQWMNAASAWLNMSQWAACSDPSLTLDDFRGLDCYIGVDLSSVSDMSAVALAAMDDNGCLLIKTWFFLPEAVLKRDGQIDRDNVALYQQWAAEGHLITTPGNMIDDAAIEAHIRKLDGELIVHKITADQWATSFSMCSRLNEDLGDDVAVILPKRAGNVTDAAREIEARHQIGPERLRHDGNPAMDWCASNAVVDRRRDGSLLPVKPTQDGKLKIDGVDAMINATAPMLLPEIDTESVYETRGLLEVVVEQV